MSFQDLEPGHVRGSPLGGRRGAGAGASQAVAAGVFQINTAVATFQRLVNTLGTPKDTPDLRDRIEGCIHGGGCGCLKPTGGFTGRARRSFVIRLYGSIFVSNHWSKEVEAVYIRSLREFQQDNQARRTRK